MGTVLLIPVLIYTLISLASNAVALSASYAAVQGVIKPLADRILTRQADMTRSAAQVCLHVYVHVCVCVYVSNSYASG
jgi:hypothetical protein